MNETLLHAWDKEHRTMLETCADEAFTVKHYVSCAELILRRKSI